MPLCICGYAYPLLYTWMVVFVKQKPFFKLKATFSEMFSAITNQNEEAFRGTIYHCSV